MSKNNMASAAAFGTDPRPRAGTVTYERTLEKQLIHLRTILEALQESLPSTRIRAASYRRTLVANALEVLDEIESRKTA